MCSKIASFHDRVGFFITRDIMWIMWSVWKKKPYHFTREACDCSQGKFAWLLYFYFKDSFQGHFRWFAGAARRSLATAWTETPHKTQTRRSRDQATASERESLSLLVSPPRTVSPGFAPLARSRAGHVPAPACSRCSNGRRCRLRSRCVPDHKLLLQEESVDTGRLLRH